MQWQDYWYVVALSEQLSAQAVLSRQVLGERLAIFRDARGQPVALQDRCRHRHHPLSSGTVHQGEVQCPYHGWRYNRTGQVCAIASEGDTFQVKPSRRIPHYATLEQDGYIYVRLSAATDTQPFTMPHYGDRTWASVRLINRFDNTVTHCAENFIDIPHTASVHPGIFRNPERRQLRMRVERHAGTVTATYHQETTNLGWFRWFLNPRGQEIQHRDQFICPNVTCVEYEMGAQRHLFITSQSIPETPTQTLVYTDVTFNYGLWTHWVKPLVRWTAQRIIEQDLVVLHRQQDTIAYYRQDAQPFDQTAADTIHVLVESLTGALARGEDPSQLSERAVEVRFWV
jgi:phenylpropionate dioxygenase-like ring-hydroxylating dioxygenase large terminal subunit